MLFKSGKFAGQSSTVIPILPIPKFNDHGITVLHWPANSPDLKPIENLCGAVLSKGRSEVRDTTMQMC